MKVTVYSVKEFERPFLLDYKDKHELKLIESTLNENTTDESEGSEAVVTFTTDTVSKEVIDKLRKAGIKYIVSRSAGTDHIHVDYAREKGIKVANAPNYSASAIAEHTVGMMLLLNRNLIKADRNIHRHDFRLDGLVGKELKSQTIGIIGVGSIGAKVTEILDGFGAKILLYDVKKNEKLEQNFNAHYTYLKELCEQSDIITIHTPLNEATKYLIDKEKFDWMKEGVIVLNLGRGGVIKTVDLIEALKSGKVARAGLDVYEKEAGLFFFDHSDDPIDDEMFAYLEANNQVFITAHQAFTTETALSNMNEMAFNSLSAWEKGEEPENAL